MAKHSAPGMSLSPIPTGSWLLPQGSKSRVWVVCEINAALLLHSDCLRPKMIQTITPGKVVGKCWIWKLLAVYSSWLQPVLCVPQESLSTLSRSILPLDKIQDFPVDLSPSHIQTLPALSFHPGTTYFHHYVRTPWTTTWSKQPLQSVKTCPGRLPITENFHLLPEDSFLHLFTEKIRASPPFWSVFYRYKIQL